MRAVLQRVKRCEVFVENRSAASIAVGLAVFVGVTHTDTPVHAKLLARKTAHLRIFDDHDGDMNWSALDVGAQVMVIPQFTLYADCQHGRRPSLSHAARPEVAKPLVEIFTRALETEGISRVSSGFFGADMIIDAQNDGPVTIIMDTENP